MTNFVQEAFDKMIEPDNTIMKIIHVIDDQYGGFDRVSVHDVYKRIEVSMHKNDFLLYVGYRTYRIIKTECVDDIYNKEVRAFLEDQMNDISNLIVVDWEETLRQYYTNVRYPRWFGRYDGQQLEVECYSIYRED